MNKPRLTLALSSLCLFAACSKEPPPRSVSELLDDPLLLEAALVRCTQDRAATRYEAECVNAREAVKQVEAKQEAERRAALEAQSKRKREALRRTQEAAAAARRRVAEAEKLRQEAEYLAQFGEAPPGDNTQAADDQLQNNMPMAVVPTAEDSASGEVDYVVDPNAEGTTTDAEVADGENAPPIEVPPDSETDLESIREELRRRADDDTSP